jgi:regulation of enolase protein 1 (concanavalin A-like superfamily)
MFSKVKFVLFVAAAVMLAGCGSPQPVEKNAVPVKTPGPTRTPTARIDKPVNISFSTFSTDWPVGWEWIDPDEKREPTPHDVKTGVLRIKVPPNKDLYGANRNAPRYLKVITGDFQIETRLKFYPMENHQGAGLLIWDDGDNYLRLERAYGGHGGGGSAIRFDLRKPGADEPLVAPGGIRTEAQSVELKIVRRGKAFSGYWREDENAEWREVGEFNSDYPDTLQVGLFACNTAEEVTAEFAYIHLLPPPGS